MDFGVAVFDYKLASISSEIEIVLVMKQLSLQSCIAKPSIL